MTVRRSWCSQWLSTVVGSVGVITISSPTRQPAAASTLIDESPWFAAPVRLVHAVLGVPWASSTPAVTTQSPTSLAIGSAVWPPTKRFSSTSTNSIWWTTWAEDGRIVNRPATIDVAT